MRSTILSVMSLRTISRRSSRPWSCLWRSWRGLRTSLCQIKLRRSSSSFITLQRCRYDCWLEWILSWLSEIWCSITCRLTIRILSVQITLCPWLLGSQSFRMDLGLKLHWTSCQQLWGVHRFQFWSLILRLMWILWREKLLCFYAIRPNQVILQLESQLWNHCPCLLSLLISPLSLWSGVLVT